jgi:hemolysin activation/secretion protein
MILQKQKPVHAVKVKTMQIPKLKNKITAKFLINTIHCHNLTVEKSIQFHKSVALAMLTLSMVSFPMLVNAQDAANLPLISSDPTKSQPVESYRFNDKTKPQQKFELPKLPKDTDTVKISGSVMVNQVFFSGNTVFSNQELAGVVADYIGRDLRAADIEALRRKISQYYIDHGYINSGAVLKSQSLADGALTVDIIEGKLTDVRQSGQEGLPEDYIKDRLIAGSGEPLNVKDLQDSYRLLLADPMIQQLNGQLLPGAHPGEALLDVRVKRARPYQLYLGSDNYQTPAVGGYTGRIGGWVDNSLSLGERIDAQFIVNDGSLGYNTGINIPLNAYDTRFNFRYSDTYSSIVEAPLDKLKITNHIIGFDGGLSHPVYRTFADDFTLGLNFVVRQNRMLFDNGNICQPIGGADKNCDMQVSVMRMAQKFSHRGDTNNVLFWSTFNVGFDALGATINPAGSASAEFMSWLGQGMFMQRLWQEGPSLVVKANMQLADKPVLSLERYSLGGAYTVRGYRENTFVRDNGFNTNIEIQYPIFSADTQEKNTLNLVPFLDYGGAWNNVTIDEKRPATEYLFSAGLGFKWQYHQIASEFYWAHAFTPVKNRTLASHDIQDDGIHFRVNVNVF